MRYEASFSEGLQPLLEGGLRTDPGFKGSLYDKEITHHEFSIKEVIKNKHHEANITLVTGKYAEGMLWGPASSLKSKTLLYPCSSWKCRLPCPCNICREKTSLCKNHEHEHSPGGGCAECQDELWEHFVFHRAEHISCKYCRQVASFLPYKRFILWKVRGYGPESWRVAVTLHSLSYLKPLGKSLISGGGGSREYECDKCSKRFHSDSGLRRHEREQHFEAKHYCQICGDQFVRKYNLTAHERTVHKGIPAVTHNFECADCSEKFTGKEMLERHNMKTKKTCSSCDKEVCTFRQLMEHMKNMHDAFSCSVCKKSFRDGDKMRRHQNIKNCDICKKALCNEQDLRKHLKEHGGESTKCKYCEKVLSTKHRLNEHVRRRTNNPCSSCHKMFCFYADLNVHNLAQHMTEKC